MKETDRVPPIPLLHDFQAIVHHWRVATGVDSVETASEIVQKLGGETGELREALLMHSPLDTAAEAADVIILSTHALTAASVALTDALSNGRRIATFAEVEEEVLIQMATGELASTPGANFERILEEGTRLEQEIAYGHLGSVGIRGAHIIYSAAGIIRQQGLPLGTVLAAKHLRNEIKYPRVQARELQAGGLSVPESFEFLKQSWDKDRDLGFLVHALTQLPTSPKR